MSDWGIKTSNTGQEVTTATGENLSMSSKYPMFKIKTQGSTTLRMAKTTLSANITNADTTIPLTSLSNIPTATLQATKYIWIYNSGLTVWEAVSYPGTTSGSSLTGCTRGYKSTTARAQTSGSTVVVGYNDTTIDHELAYPPVHMVFKEDTVFGKTMVPCALDAFGVTYAKAWVDTANLYISVEYGDQDISNMTPSGDYTEHSFKYTIMHDSILTPYY